MRLEHICDMALAYREEPLYEAALLLMRPYGTEEGSAYGEGDGTVSGPKLRGKVRWVNHPHRRSDGMMLPDTHGVIVTDDQAKILFSFQGRTRFENDLGKQVLVTIFETDDERYRWLNTTICILEGLIGGGRPSMQAHVYACIHELV